MRLSGLVDVYLPDLKYFSDEAGRVFSDVDGYFGFASKAIIEMRRQVPRDEFDGEMMSKGLIVRHLVLPGQIDDSKRVLDWLADNLGNQTIVSLMAQYYPTHLAEQCPPLDRRLTAHEYARVCDHFVALGFAEGFVQELSSAEPRYTPDFKLEGI
jgi:putative pyruvate formate lyase activating enzyme